MQAKETEIIQQRGISRQKRSPENVTSDGFEPLSLQLAEGHEKCWVEVRVPC